MTDDSAYAKRSLLTLWIILAIPLFMTYLATVKTGVGGKTKTAESAAAAVNEPEISCTPDKHRTSEAETADQNSTKYMEPRYTRSDIEMLARTVWGEARGCAPDEQRLVVWTVLHRVDAGGWFGGTMKEVLTKPGQFIGYREQNPVDPAMYTLCAEEIGRWIDGETAPTLAPYATETPYFYFSGRRGNDGQLHNFFRRVW